ncbi:MAG: 4Fe-4S dicluster domain-containing protein [Bacteroidetes bacterium]|nr:4Fe-4S dicluster domain-containing protein [Bacteroidota bacterium]
MDSENKPDRRKFLRSSFLALGAGFLSGSLLESCDPENDTGEQVAVLTPDGKLVSVPKSKLSSEHSVITNAEGREGIPGRKFVMVIDLSKCDGCGKCTEACNKMHFLPPTKEWIEVLKMQDNTEEAPYWFPKNCFHCDNPPCTKVCPVDATFKREDGIVAIDNERCIGCRFCMAACPYSARTFNWAEPIKPNIIESNESIEHVFQSKKGCVEKCDFCPHMAREGKLPGCVTGCPMDAIYFGDEIEDAVTDGSGNTFRLSQMLEEKSAYRFMEELGTQPRVYYLPPYSRMYPGPEKNQQS